MQIDQAELRSRWGLTHGEWASLARRKLLPPFATRKHARPAEVVRWECWQRRKAVMSLVHRADQTKTPETALMAGIFEQALEDSTTWQATKRGVLWQTEPESAAWLLDGDWWPLRVLGANVDAIRGAMKRAHLLELAERETVPGGWAQIYAETGTRAGLSGIATMG